jgi:DNA-binding CsgD family transcriptional regulator
MTRMVLLGLDQFEGCSWFDDDRSPRELLVAINTGAYQPDCEGLPVTGPFSAILIGNPRFVVVLPGAPPVDLSARLYQVLYAAFGEGKLGSEVAAELGITVRTVYAYYQQLKRRFDARSMHAVFIKALYLRLI